MTRSEAIEHLKNIAIYSVQDGYTDEARQALDMAIKALEEPERKKGKWIDNDKINFPQCSECGMWIDVMQQSGEMNYCHHCGADMRQMEDDNV